MEKTIAVALAVFAVMLTFGIAMFMVISERRGKTRKIKEAAQLARRAEKARIRENLACERRIALQDEIGDRIYWSLVRAWRVAGEPKDREPRRICHNFGQNKDGSYYIQLSKVGSSDPIHTCLEIVVNLRKERNSQVYIRTDFELGLGNFFVETSVTDAEGLLSTRKEEIFAAAAK
ncbi:MAG: hypothetical protein Q8R08_01315 [bacterium]|nr:hypothetical protein [bacterium]